MVAVKCAKSSILLCPLWATVETREPTVSLDIKTSYCINEAP